MDNNYNNAYDNQASYNFQTPPPNYSPQVSYYVPSGQPQPYPADFSQTQGYAQSYPPTVYASNYYPQPYTSMDFSSMPQPVNQNQKAISLYNVSLIILTLMDVFGYSFLILSDLWFAFSFIVIFFITFVSAIAVPRKSVIAMSTMAVFRILYVLYLLGFGSFIVINWLIYTGNPAFLIIFYIASSIYLGFTIAYVISVFKLSRAFNRERQENAEVQYSVVDMDVYNVQSI